MLVLSRKIEEEFIITIPPSNSTRTMMVKLVEVSRGKAKIGFIAPDSVTILRAELEDLPVESEGGEL